MRILVTGGAGFIGSHLVSALLGKGHEVRVADNFSTGKRSSVSPDVQLFEGDVTDYRVTKPAVKGADVVVHLAAIPWVQYSVDYPAESWQATAQSSYIVFRWAARQDVKRVIFTSSCAAADHVPSPYGEAKRKAEDYLSYWYKCGKFETVCLRLFNVYSHKQQEESRYSRVIPAFVRQVMTKQPMTVNGDGLQTRDFIHVDDVVRSLIAAIEKPKLSGKTMDIGTGVSTSILDLGRAIAKAAGVEPKFFHGAPLSDEMRSVKAYVSTMKQDLGITEVLPLEQGLLKSVQSFPTV